ncbi:MAG: hypothetical protein IT208_00670 [Chthonomonadales bacterium]|nr:hypothetical protein [Chthonomonadales bacterium]
MHEDVEGGGEALAPPGWRYAHFPLATGPCLEVDVEAVAVTGEVALAEAERTGDQSHIGPAMHWAHVLKSEQGACGDWPARVDARTGAPVGVRRTLAPVRMLRLLARLLGTTEFDAALAAAAVAQGA